MEDWSPWYILVYLQEHSLESELELNWQLYFYPMSQLLLNSLSCPTVEVLEPVVIQYYQVFWKNSEKNGEKVCPKGIKETSEEI